MVCSTTMYSIFPEFHARFFLTSTLVLSRAKFCVIFSTISYKAWYRKKKGKKKYFDDLVSSRYLPIFYKNSKKIYWGEQLIDSDIIKIYENYMKYDFVINFWKLNLQLVFPVQLFKRNRESPNTYECTLIWDIKFFNFNFKVSLFS